MINYGRDLNKKHVKSYWIKEYSSGIIALLFNTNERWIAYHQQNDETYEFWPDGCDSEVIEIDSFLPEDRNYICTEHQCKDQVVYYYIPFKLMED